MRSLALVVAVLACGAIAVAIVVKHGDASPAPVVVPPSAAPVAAPPPVAAAAPRSPIDEKIVAVAAAADAPVIAVASAHRVWISRDGGKTFARALEGHGGVYSVFVEPGGRVYVLWQDVKSYGEVGGGHVSTDEFTLGIAEPDGRERWRELPDVALPPMDARDGWIASAGTHDTTRALSGLAIGSGAGESWNGVPSPQKWAVLATAMGDHHTARFLASRTALDEEGVGHGLYLLAATDGRVKTVWSTMQNVQLVTDEFPRDIVSCAGFAGSTMYLVIPKIAHHGVTLVSVDGAGKVRERELDASVAPIGSDGMLTCAIAGNDRAAYINVGNDVIRIDSDDLRIADDPHGDFDAMAVDAHGFLLYLAGGCVHRYDASEAKHHSELVCGPPS